LVSGLCAIDIDQPLRRAATLHVTRIAARNAHFEKLRLLLPTVQRPDAS
jgi:hypothetical protein